MVTVEGYNGKVWLIYTIINNLINYKAKIDLFELVNRTVSF